MRKVIIALVILALGAGAYFAYKKYFKADDLVNSIPGDALMVGSVDMKSIVEKAGGSELNNFNMFKRLREEVAKQNDPVNKVILELMNDPLKSGINFMHRIYFFASTKNEKPIFGLTCSLHSSSDFESILKKFPLKDSIVQSNGLKKIKLDNEALLSWNDKQLIFLGGMNEGLDTYTEEMFAHKNPSISSVTGFRDFTARSFDFGMFINYSSLLSMTKNLSPAGSPMPGAEMYKGMYADFTTSFEKNSIESKMQYYFADEKVKESMLMLNEKGLSDDHSKLISPKSIFSILSISFNPEKLLNIFEQQEMYAGMIKEMEQQIGLQHDELKKLLNGNVSLALVGFKNEISERRKYDYNEATGQMITTTVPDTTMMPIFTATLGIDNRQAFDKLIKSTGLPKDGPYYVIDTPFLKIYLIENKTGITVTNDKMIADEIVAKKELAVLTEPVKSLVTQSPCAFYLDLNLKHYPDSLLTTLESFMGNDGYHAFQNTMALFENMQAKASRNSGEFDLNLVEGSDNSLHRILNAIDKNVYPVVVEKIDARKKMMEEYQHRIDSMSALEGDNN